jgi:hypothetical protein
LTNQTPIIAPGTLSGRARAPGRPITVARRLAELLWATGPRRLRPFLDSEPRRTPGPEVKPAYTDENVKGWAVKFLLARVTPSRRAGLGTIGPVAHRLPLEGL